MPWGCVVACLVVCTASSGGRWTSVIGGVREGGKECMLVRESVLEELKGGGGGGGGSGTWTPFERLTLLGNGAELKAVTLISVL